MPEVLWKSYLDFETNKMMRNSEEKEERLMLLESWRNFEEEFGAEPQNGREDKLMPEKVKNRRKIQAEDGSDAGWEECYHDVFPEDAANQPKLKLLAMAKLWRKRQQEEDTSEQHSEEDMDAIKS